MIMFRLKAPAYMTFLCDGVGVIKVPEIYALSLGSEVKIANAERPDDPPLYATVKGTHFERDPKQRNAVLACYVVETP